MTHGGGESNKSSNSHIGGNSSGGPFYLSPQRQVTPHWGELQVVNYQPKQPVVEMIISSSISESVGSETKINLPVSSTQIKSLKNSGSNSQTSKASQTSKGMADMVIQQQNQKDNQSI